MTQQTRDVFDIAVDDCVDILQETGHQEDAEEVQLFADTGEIFLAVVKGVCAMNRYGLPVKLVDAQLAYDVGKSEGWDDDGDDMIAVKRAIADAKKRSVKAAA